MYEMTDAYLLYVNCKPLAIDPEFERIASLGESVAQEQPEVELTIRVADRLSAQRQPIVDPEAKCWVFDRTSWSWSECGPDECPV
jgi:hypothetical protein